MADSAPDSTDVIQGTLDLLILKTLSLEPMHGFGIARRVEQVSRAVFKVNPGSLLLSGVLMFEHLGWQNAADDIIRALEATIAEKIVTYDFARLMDGATEVKCSEFASAIVERL